MENMENANNTENTSTEGAQEKTFTQEDVNRIVQERLAKEKGRGSEELNKRMAELDMRERKLNAVSELRKNGLPEYLVDALNISTDEAFQKSMEAVIKMKGEAKTQPKAVGYGSPIGNVGGSHKTEDATKAAMGLK